VKSGGGPISERFNKAVYVESVDEMAFEGNQSISSSSYSGA
jgi:hypothetical protein